MVTLGSKRIHIVFADSRAGGLQDCVNRLNNSGEHMDINEYKGATLEELIGIAEKYLPLHPFDVVYIAGGANNITSKNRLTRKISYPWELGTDLQDHLVSTLTKANAHFVKTFPASKVIFCPLVGSDLDRVVNSGLILHDHKQDVENAIWEFNTNVFRISNERGTKTPALHHQVHRYCNGKRRVYYEHLHDGIHLSEFLKEKWAHQFVKVMAQN